MAKYYLGESAAKRLERIMPFVERLMKQQDGIFSKPKPGFKVDSFLAKITSVGPMAEVDFTNSQYWIREIFCTNTDEDSLTLPTFETPERPEEIGFEQWDSVVRWVMATHLVEIEGETHILSTDDDLYVIVYVIPDQNNLPKYYFNVLGRIKFRAKLLGSEVITPNRWLYSFVQVVLNELGLFTTVGGGITSTAYNTIETNNVVCDVLGSGDSVLEFPIGVTEQPIGPGAVVEMSAVLNCNGVIEYLFQVGNNAGGVC